MKKMIKVILSLLIVGVVLISAISIYVGNYFYDYTLNPHSKKNIFEKLNIDEEKGEEARKWLGENARSINITSLDGLRLHSYYIDQGSDITVMMIHGYRSNGTSIIDPIKKMKSKKYNLLIPDLRGHGLSEGDYIGMGWDEREDIMLWIDDLIERNHQSIILYGVSMGGATVLNVSGENLPLQVKSIISDCGYTSVIDVLEKHLDLKDTKNKISLMLADFVTRIRAGYRIEDVKPLKQVSQSKTPILFIHGEKDDFIPVEMVYELYNQTKSHKQLLVLSKAKHANSYRYGNIYYKTIYDFIDLYTKNNSKVDEFEGIYH